jgi:hypothetical protein
MKWISQCTSANRSAISSREVLIILLFVTKEYDLSKRNNGSCKHEHVISIRLQEKH